VGAERSLVVRTASQPRYLKPGDKLGKYELIRQIAIGGMAELYLARTVGIEGFEKLVVVKRILPQYTDNRSFVNMFLNEARLAATLHHPNIAQVYDIGIDDGDYFFSMEYIHGEDLGRLTMTAVENGVPISLDVALTLVAGLCAGLHYAHEKIGQDGKPLNVVHRDVSPSNVIVTYDGAVKLVDFGIARANNTSSKPGLKGKIAYMSPEQCRGKGVIDRRSDVFSIGTILYELTTGQLPFTDENEYGILNQIVNQDAEPPSKLVPGYAPALEAIVMRALARDPLKRYRTALELQGELEDFAHENRLRVSPLVLTRLMSALFSSRLEDWGEAKTQGAFFVEQHVVRTLIESGKTGEGEAFPTAAAAAAAAEAQAQHAERPDAVTKATAIEPPAEYDPPTSQLMTPVPGPMVRRTPVPASETAPMGRTPVHAVEPVPMVAGTLVSPRQSDASLSHSGEMTARVRLTPPPDATTLVAHRAPRSRVPLMLVLGALGVAASFVGTFLRSNRSSKVEVAPIHAPIPTPSPTDPQVATPDPGAPQAVAPTVTPVVTSPGDPMRADLAPSAADLAPSPPAPSAGDPQPPVNPPRARVEPTETKPLIDPAAADKHTVAQHHLLPKPPVVVPKVKPRPKTSVKQDKQDKSDKPDPKPDPKETEWNPDSPLLPVRPGR
jgi:serine/threonine protein kinase